MVDRIEERDFDVQVKMFPIETHEKYQLGLTEKETMEAIGRLATALFTLLNQTQPKTPPMMGVVVIKETVETTIFETDEVEAQNAIEEEPKPASEIAEAPLPPAIEETVQNVIEEAPELAPEIVEIPLPAAPVEAAPEIAAEEIKIDFIPNLSRAQIEQLIESHRRQIQLLSQAALQERQLLKTQEQFQILKQLNSSPHRISSAEDLRAEHLNRIAHFEREIQRAQEKMLELQQTLQDIRG